MTLMTLDLKDNHPLLTLAFKKRGAHIRYDPVLEGLIQAGFSVLQVDKAIPGFQLPWVKTFSAW